MKMLFRIIIPLLLILHTCSADVSHLKSVKAKLLQNLASHLKEKTHHKRGIFSGVPSYKAGYDFPVVHHSFIKPLFIQHPPKLVPLGVKIPLKNHYGFNYPVPVGHRVPIPYPGYGLKFPSLTTKPVILPPPPPPVHHLKPAIPIHFHPVKPEAPFTTSVTPIHPVPTVPFTQVLPAVAPPLHFHPIKPVVPVHHTPLVVRPAVFPVHQVAVHPAPIPVHPAPIPVHPAPIPVHPTPFIPVAQHVPFVIKPGTSTQSSYFATYPKYPFIQTAPPVLQGGVALNNINQPIPVFPRPTVHIPHYDLLAPEQHIHGAPHILPGGPLLPTPTVQQLQPTLLPQDNSGWSPVTHPTVPTLTTQPDVHQPAPTQAITSAHGYSLHNAQQYSHETPVYENQEGDQGYAFDQNLLQQPYDQSLQDQQYHPQQFDQQQQYDQAQQYHQQQQDQQQYNEQQQQQYNQHQYNQQEQQYQHQQQEYDQQQQQQQYDHQQQYDKQQQYDQQQHQYDQQQYYDQQQGYDQNAQSIQREGQFDSSQEEVQKNVQEGEDSQSSQRYRNHIPLGLQLPLKRPLDEFQ